MLVLRELTLEGFQPFRDKTVIRFPRNGLIRLRGKNLDSGGDSGAGKSAILNGLAHLFGYGKLPSTALQCWWTTTPMRVQGLFVDTKQPQVPIKIERAGSKLNMWFGSSKVTGGASVVEDALVRLTGAAPKLLGALTYRPQQSPSAFLSMRDSDRKEFLSDLLGLTEFERQADEAGKKANKLETALQAAQAALDVLQTRIVRPEPYEPVDFKAEEIKVQQLKGRQVEVQVLLDTCVVEREALEGKRVWAINEAAKPFDEEYLRIQEERRAHPSVPPSVTDPGRGKLIERIALVRKTIDKLLTDHSIAVQNLRDQLTGKRQAARKERDRAARLPAIEKAIEGCEASIKMAKEGRCPTCERAWDTASHHVAAQETRIKTLQGERQVCLDAAQLADGIERALGEGEAALAILERQVPVPQQHRDMLAKLEAALAGSDQKLASDRALAQAEWERKGSEIELRRQDVLRRQTEARNDTAAPFDTQLTELDDAIETHESTLRDLQHEIDLKESDICRFRAVDRERAQAFKAASDRYAEDAAELDRRAKTVENIQRSWAAERDFVALIGRAGFLGSIFDEVLTEIAVEVNERLLALPNVQHTSFAFRSERETGDGTLKKEIRVVITVEGREVPFEALSGGQKTSVAMAVDRAVATVGARRVGVQPGWLVLDEAFDGMDLVTKESSLEILKQISQEILVIVVDHTAEFKELFDGYIDIEMKDRVARVVSE